MHNVVHKCCFSVIALLLTMTLYGEKKVIFGLFSLSLLLAFQFNLAAPPQPPHNNPATPPQPLDLIPPSPLTQPPPPNSTRSPPYSHNPTTPTTTISLPSPLPAQHYAFLPPQSPFSSLLSNAKSNSMYCPKPLLMNSNFQKQKLE